jgi:hypothetical protein
MPRNVSYRFALFACSALLVAALSAGFHPSPVAADADDFNQPGNTLIADQFNNRVIEVEPDGEIVWQFGKGPADFTAASIIGVNDAQRVGSLTLMAGTGTPGGQPEAPNCTDPNGCPDNRVLLVNRAGRIVWQYGTFGPGGNGPGQLNTPTQVTWTPNRHVLITDQANGRIIEVRVSDKQTVWEYDGLNGPNCAELLENGHILICDEGNNQALEVTHTTPSTVLHAYTMAAGVPFSAVAFASRLANGHTLITDSGNARIVETDENGKVFWQYFTNTDPASNPRCLPAPTGCTGPLPTRALRLRNGHTLISDQYNHRVIEVDHEGEIVRTFGKINSLGYNTTSVKHGGLNSPYDAKQIGDYTGITPPFDKDQDADEQ